MTTLELSTTDVSPFLITEEQVEAFGNATKDYNKFHEKYIYGSQITAWLKRAMDCLVASSGFNFECLKVRCKFKEPVENDSEIRLPEKVIAEIKDGLTIEAPIYSEKKIIVEARATYGVPERKNIEAKPNEILWRSYPLTESGIQNLAYAVGGTEDPLLLAIGLASPALQRYNEKNRVLPAGMLVYLEQTVAFYNHCPLEAGERVCIGIEQVRKTAGVGIVDLVLARRKQGKTREGIAKARFFIGTAKQNEGSGLEKAVLAQTF